MKLYNNTFFTGAISLIKRSTLTSLMAGALILSNSTSLMATAPETMEKAAKENVRREIVRQISCPDFVTDNSIANDVKALVSVDEQGKITVHEINSANVALRQYVVNTLKEMKIKNGEAVGPFILIVKFRVG